jgi:hypothetical protein
VRKPSRQTKESEESSALKYGNPTIRESISLKKNRESIKEVDGRIKEKAVFTNRSRVLAHLEKLESVWAAELWSGELLSLSAKGRKGREGASPPHPRQRWKAFKNASLLWLAMAPDKWASTPVSGRETRCCVSCPPRATPFKVRRDRATRARHGKMAASRPPEQNRQVA